MVEQILAAIERCRAILPKRGKKDFVRNKELQKGLIRREFSSRDDNGKIRTAIVTLRNHPLVEMVTLTHLPGERDFSIKTRRFEEGELGLDVESLRGGFGQHKYEIETEELKRGTTTHVLKWRGKRVCVINHIDEREADIIRIHPGHAERIARILFSSRPAPVSRQLTAGR